MRRPASPRTTPLLAALLPALLAACSSPAAPAAGGSKFLDDPTGAAGVSSSTDFERYFPLVDGTLYHYETTNDAGDRGILIARVHRTDAAHGELILPSGKKRFTFTDQGVRLEPSGAFVLAGPIAAGTTFRGQNGGRAVIEDVQVVIDVKAGSYRGCLRVVEQRGGDSPARHATTFCPGVGIVALEVEAGTAFERAELVSAGPPVNLEKDGVTVIPGEPASAPPAP